MTSYEIGGEMLPEETLNLATAITLRRVREDQIVYRIRAELAREPYDVGTPEQVAQQIELGSTILWLAKVDDPSVPVELRQKLKDTPAEVEHELLTRDWSRNLGIATEAERLRGVSQLMGDFMGRGSYQQVVLGFNQFVQILNAARTLANELGNTSLEQVYAQDDLYLEARRRSITLQKYAEPIVVHLAIFNEEMGDSILFKRIDRERQQPSFADNTNEQQIEQATAAQQDFVDQAIRSRQIDLILESVRQSFMYQVVRTWGLEAFDTLPEEQKEVLRPRRPLVALVRQAMERV